MPGAFAIARPAAGRKTEHHEPGDAARRLARRVQVGTDENAPSSTMSASPVRTSSHAAARVHRVVEVARLALKKPVSWCRNLVRMSAKGRRRSILYRAEIGYSG